MALVDSASLVAAAVRAACQCKAPRRTIVGVAAAVAKVVLLPAAPKVVRVVASGRHSATDLDAGDKDSPEALLAALRLARRTQRRQKKARRRERDKHKSSEGIGSSVCTAETRHGGDVVAAADIGQGAVAVRAPDGESRMDCAAQPALRVGRVCVPPSRS